VKRFKINVPYRPVYITPMRLAIVVKKKKRPKYTKLGWLKYVQCIEERSSPSINAAQDSEFISSAALLKKGRGA
jgi:hypothetical protein